MLLWEDAVALQHPGKRRAKIRQPQEQELSQEDLNAKRCTKFVKEGQYRKAAQALTSAGLAQDCPATVAALRELHPQLERTAPSLEEPNAPPLQFMSDQVIQAVKSFQAGTAPGPSGLRAQH